ncbi:MAG: hypothetical protein CMP61_09555 [Flavobacteriales bacterium]|nr:hypothetical protein [Flavobacteriales bacterium]|tara:strand:- start:20234 stop:21220 length:987 start_codon:yes stop_codon:yes gene_type:complete
MKKILLTFDYELFLLQSGSIENCIIKPVDLLLKTFDKTNIKAVFFVDILFLLQLEKEGLKSDYELVEKNIQLLIEKGHQVELHLHPHWIDAKYNAISQEWNLSKYENYKLQSLNQKDLNSIFDQGYNKLTKICQTVNPNYKITSFRAGGLCIQPFNVLKPLFEKYNIKIDSSVLVGGKIDSPAQSYDFTLAPKKEIYKFEDEPSLEVKKGSFTQIPIFTYKKNLIDKILGKIQRNNSEEFKIFGDGKALPPKSSLRVNKLSKLKSDSYIYSLDGNFNDKLLLNKIISSNQQLITILSHPKLLSPKSADMIKKLHEMGNQFVTISDLNI